MKTVSIICTNYNKGEWLRDAVNSFLGQKTTFDTEIILVDDASTDHSPEIIQELQECYPKKIRAFFNLSNQGITKTWKNICLEAKGEYIARCDGDDFWTDPYKLQKQMNLLVNQSDSRWSTTDFDMVDTNGIVTQADVLKNGILPRMSSYEEVLALKGMTMSSTWLVDKELMLEVNEVISDDATDDTFNLQLELFRRTKCTFLDESTTVYRITQNSDSRPKDLSKIESRINGLMKTQLDYLEKYPEQDLLTIAKLQVEREAWQEKRAFEQELVINDLKHQLTLIHADRDRLLSEQEQLTDQYNRVISSRRWIIPTKLINFFRRKP